MSVDTIKVSELTSSPRRGLIYAIQEADQTLAEPLISTNQALHVYDIMVANAIDALNGVMVVEQGQFTKETVAASQTNQVIGVTGGLGDYLQKLILVPATTSPGAVTYKDGANATVTVFAGGATSVADLKPFVIEFNEASQNGAWQITTGANISVIAIGRFTA